MSRAKQDQLSIEETERADDDLGTWIEAFLIDRKVQNLTPGTLYFYREKFKLFIAFCKGEDIQRISQITANVLRRYLLHLQEKGHNPGGQHAALRAVKTLLLWYGAECQPDNWVSPTRRVKLPKLATDPLDPVSSDVFERLTEACGDDIYGRRDRALLEFLLDTGARASECLACNLADLDQVSGAVLIRQGKGRKPRTVYLGKKARRSMRAYLRMRKDKRPGLWISRTGERMTYDGLRDILRRLSDRAGVPFPNPHSFRRAFALACLRNGMDVYTLQTLMGHADLQVLRRYLKQDDQDVHEAHAAHGPVDNLREERNR
jgi:integrase/recombinase XerD